MIDRTLPVGLCVNVAPPERADQDNTTTEERGLCAVCLTPASKCAGKTCRRGYGDGAYPSINDLWFPAVRGVRLHSRPTDQDLELAADELEFGDEMNTGAGPAREATARWIRYEKSPIVLSVRLEQLGKTIAHQVWEANGCTTESIAPTPALEAWAHHAYVLGWLDCDRPFLQPEAGLLTHVYRNEIAELAGVVMDKAAIEDPAEWPAEAGKAERVLTRAMLDGVPADEAWARAKKVCPAYETSGASGRDDRAPTSENAENLNRATVARPTDRQLAFMVDVIKTGGNFTPNHLLCGEVEKSKAATLAWLQTLVSAELVEQVRGEIDACDACGGAMRIIDGNMACPECEASRVAAHTESAPAKDVEKLDTPTDSLSEALAAIGSVPPRPTDPQLIRAAYALDGCRFSKERQAEYATALATLPGYTPDSSDAMLREYQEAIATTALWLKDVGSGRAMARYAESLRAPPAACTTHATVPTAETVEPGYDSGNASKAASISAEAAARDAMARGADPLIVVDLALREIARFREKTGLSPQYVAQDPLAALVVELRHKRVPPAFARVVRALALAGREEAQMKDGYDDGHERRHGDWSLDHLLDLADLAAMEGSREEVAEKAVAVAEFLASMLPGWQEAIAYDREESDLEDPKIHAEIDSAADAFIAGLVKASR